MKLHLVALLAAAPLCLCQPIPLDERTALMDLYRSTNGGQWKDPTNWGTEVSPCEWFGVTCGGGHITSLRMLDNNLRGALPSSLDSLQHLNELDLAINQLSGSIPGSLARIPTLTTLDVRVNQLTGPVPEPLLARWDKFEIEFTGFGNRFSNFVSAASFEWIATGGLCSSYRADFDVTTGKARYEAVQCASPKTRNTYCLVREGSIRSLERFTRALRVIHYADMPEKQDTKFSFSTHDLLIDTHVTRGDGSRQTVETYGDEGPGRWIAQHLFLSLASDLLWEKEYRLPHCTKIE
jgi:Leucine rich repeat N-terminal domain